MSEFARLEDKLAKLRQRERAPGERRKIRGADPEAILAAMVTEIDEIILPRRLNFKIDANNSLSFAVGNRRLQALLSPPPAGIDAALADQELPDADDPRIAALAVGIRAALDGVESVEISTARPKKLFASDIGVPAVQLERVWGVSTSETKPVDPSEILKGFLKGVGEDANAWLRIEGEAVAEQGGDDAQAAELAEKTAIFLDGYFSKFETVFPEPSLSCGTVISPGTDHERALFFIEIGDVSAVISAKPGRVLALASRWQKLVAD